MDKEASQEDRDKIVKAISEGPVEWDNPASVDRMLDAVNRGELPDYTVTEVNIDSSFGFSWSTRTAGFGTVSFWIENGQIMCDNEGMDRAFIKEVLCKIVDEAKFVDEQ